MGGVDWSGLMLLALVLYYADRPARMPAVRQPRPHWRTLFARMPRTDP